MTRGLDLDRLVGWLQGLGALNLPLGTIDGDHVLDWTRLTQPFNMTRSPAGTVCAGFTASGLPIGLQVVGHQHSDVAVLQADRMPRRPARPRHRRADLRSEAMADVAAFNAAVRELAPFIAELGIVATAVEARPRGSDRRVETRTVHRRRHAPRRFPHGVRRLRRRDVCDAQSSRRRRDFHHRVENQLPPGCTAGTITGVAVPVHVGRRTIVVQTDISRDDGKLVSRTTQTQAVLTD